MIQTIRHLVLGTRRNKGAVLVLALIVMGFVIAVIPAMVLLMNTGARTGIMYERNNNELYTADAGVQDAVNFIKTLDLTDLPEDPFTYDYTYNFGEKYGYDINEKLAQVTISTVHKTEGILYFKVFSQGQSPSGEDTSITAYINAFDSWLFSEHAFTTPEYFAFKENGVIIGGAQLPGGWNGKGDIDVISDEPILGWPTADFFATYYIDQVDTTDDYMAGGTIITVPENANTTEEAIYCDGDLTIDPQGGNSGSSLTLDGTWYIEGDLNINSLSKKGLFTLDLNGNTIFVEGEFWQDTASGQKQIDIKGPGAIVAIGNITFAPAANTIDEPIFILSIEGAVDIWPRGTFYGSIVSRLSPKVQPNTTIYWPNDFDWGGLNLPTESEYDLIIGNIESWEIDNPYSGIRIGPYVLPFAEVGIGYPDQTLQATGGTPEYVWSISTSSTIPDGLNFSSDGVLSGTPSEVGKFYFTVQAVDQDSTIGKQVVTVTVKPQPVIDTSVPLPGGNIGEFYDGRLIVQGGVPSYEWEITSGSLPDGLVLDQATGQISGVPSISDTYDFEVTLTDGYGVQDIESFTITINAI